MEIRKSQLRDKLGCWEVVRGFNPLPMASDFPPTAAPTLASCFFSRFLPGLHHFSKVSPLQRLASPLQRLASPLQMFFPLARV